MLFSLLKHYLDTDTALKVSKSVYCFTTSISHGVENYFPRLWGTGISDTIFFKIDLTDVFIYLGFNVAFNTLDHIMKGRFMVRGNQYTQLVKVL